MALAVAVAAGVAASLLLPAPARSAGPRLVLAFYYTWFDENTWTPAKVPDFPAESYVSRDPAAMDRHIAQAQGAGIDALVVSWYGPWSNQTEANFAQMLDVAAARNFKLALDVEVTSPFAPGGTAGTVEMLRHALSVHANHPAYLRVDGKPVLFFWRQQRYGVDTWRAIREQVDPGRGSIWIAEGVDMSYQAVFDGHHLYSVTWNPPADMATTANKFGRYVENARQQYGGQRYWVATVMPGYDDTRTGRGNAFARSRQGGAYYAESWQAAINSNPDWIVITSFNEWPEGTYIEPSQAYGDQYLQLTSEWAGRFKSGSPAPAPDPPALATAEAPAGAQVSPPTLTAAPAPTPAPEPTPDYAALRVQADSLNVRMAPSIDADRITQVASGDILRPAARLADGSWWKVCCPSDRLGWVSAEYVEAIGPAGKIERVPTIDLAKRPEYPPYWHVPR
jgi:hypothetical protein